MATDGASSPKAAPPAALIRHHPRSPGASMTRLRDILGFFKLTGPAPSGRFLDDQEEADETMRTE